MDIDSLLGALDTPWNRFVQARCFISDILLVPYYLLAAKVLCTTHLIGTHNPLAAKALFST